ncbi:MAG: RIP metalloprotease RseP [Lachnospiraceae bacterium]|jgi:regulator of sigma E protease|nr:RIP metalloprotease RseP [Lachnospiraceae bacterium]
MNILLALLVFSVLVFFHEFGHFLLAKRNGVGVREFNIGFGPKIVRFTHKETEYSIGIILFGGACIMEGEEEDSESDTSFTSKSPAARLSILAAGPIFNFLLAFIFALIIIGSVGIDYPVLAGVSEGSPAEAAGLQENDLITGIDGSRVFCFRDISLFMLNYRGDKEITLRYERDGETKEATFWPVYDTERESFMMGISVYSYRTPTSGVLETIRLSAHEVRYWMSYTLASLRMLFQGEVSPKELSGPVGIVNMVNDVVEETKEDGAFYVFLNLVNLAMLLSVNLGVVNLLPFPALDGGRIVFVLIEMIIGRPVPRDKEGIVHLIGMILLLILMVYVFYNDIMRLIG